MKSKLLMMSVFLLLLVGTGLIQAQETVNLLPNGDFETASGDFPENWQVWGDGGQTHHVKGTGIDSSACLQIRLDTPHPQDGIIILQDLKLEPYRAYLLSGYIRGENIRPANPQENEVPASIATSMWHCDSISTRSGIRATGTFDWTPFTLDFATGPDGRQAVMCRFGSGKMLGTAWFDNLIVMPNPDVEHFEGKHLILNLYKDEVAAATRKGVENAIANTDILFEAYAELTGHMPDDGKPMSAWAPKLWDHGALGWSGNPLLWTADKAWMQENWTRDGYCPEIFLHEAAHNFDYGPWIFDCHFSELMFYYACETRDLGISEDTGFRRGPAVRDRWEVRSEPGFPDICAVVLRGIHIRDKIGWEPFRKTFRWYLSFRREPVEAQALVDFSSRATGRLDQEIWTEIPGEKISDLTNAPAFALQPTLSGKLENGFETTVDFAEEYGQRLRGYLTPPATGDYTLWISSDDASELYLSPDENPESKRLIAQVENYTAPHEISFVSQQSDPVQLEAGKLYYVEVLHKEGGGGDHLSVAWSMDPAARLPQDWTKAQENNWERFKLYFNKLSEYAGQDTLAMFTPDELALLEWAYLPEFQVTQNPAEVSAEVTSAWLSDLQWENAKVGWFNPARNRTGDGKPLQSATTWHKQGLYAHASSHYVFNLNEQWKSLTTAYAMQKNAEGSVVFVIIGDGAELFRSDRVTNANEQHIEVDISGIKKLELIVEDAGDGANNDWSLWLSPQLLR